MTLNSSGLTFQKSSTNVNDACENNHNVNNDNDRCSEGLPPSYAFAGPPTSRVVRRQGSGENERGYDSSASRQQSNSDVTRSASKSSKITLSEHFAKREKGFEKELREVKGFVIKEMRSDGACMFRAVAHQVYGDAEMHKLVRKHCMDYMEQNGDFFSKYIPEDFELYVKRKRDDHTYGDHVEIQALSEIYNRPIEVYQYSTEPINTFNSGYQNNNGNPPIRLSYHGNIHYNSIIDPENPHVGVGLGYKGELQIVDLHNTGVDSGYTADDLQIVDLGDKVGVGLEYKHDLEIVDLNNKEQPDDVEEAIIEDKIKVTDWEATDKHLAHITAWQSYIEWMHAKKPTSTFMGVGSDASVPSTSFAHNNTPDSTSFQLKKGYSISGLPNTLIDKPTTNITDSATPNKTKSEDAYSENKENIEGVCLNEDEAMLGYLAECEDDDHGLTFALVQSRQEYFDSFK